jgi:MoaA/NifB/PqqE/SkfB family radical SAM enzyme
MKLPFVSIDIEPTNRCNAKCYFCPRDATPHQGLMSREVFDQSLWRALEFREFSLEKLQRDIAVTLCGLGEPLLNRQTPDFVQSVRDAGLECTVSSNAALLDEAMSRRLLDAGMTRISINVGDRGEDYEEIYKLPWERTRDNVLRFGEMAGDACEIQIVLVNHRRELGHIQDMIDYWTEAGFTDFFRSDLINRGGALFVDHMQYERFDELESARALLAETGDYEAVCHAPFVFLFIGYDGQYYLCCSDWKKEAPFGSVFERSFVDVTGVKLANVTTRSPVCSACNFDPVNRMAEKLQSLRLGEIGQDEVDHELAEIMQEDGSVDEFLAAAKVDRSEFAGGGPTPRRLIPVRVDLP